MKDKEYPMKVILEANVNGFECYCPRCKQDLLDDNKVKAENTIRYCFNCGQRLDWDVEVYEIE